MIVLDSSILVGIIKVEAESERLVDLLAAEPCAIGAPTLVEARVWCATNLAARTSRWLEAFIDGEGISVVPFSRDMADVASHAFGTFGRADIERSLTSATAWLMPFPQSCGRRSCSREGILHSRT